MVCFSSGTQTIVLHLVLGCRLLLPATRRTVYSGFGSSIRLLQPRALSVTRDGLARDLGFG